MRDRKIYGKYAECTCALKSMFLSGNNRYNVYLHKPRWQADEVDEVDMARASEDEFNAFLRSQRELSSKLASQRHSSSSSPPSSSRSICSRLCGKREKKGTEAFPEENLVFTQTNGGGGSDEDELRSKGVWQIEMSPSGDRMYIVQDDMIEVRSKDSDFTNFEFDFDIPVAAAAAAAAAASGRGLQDSYYGHSCVPVLNRPVAISACGRLLAIAWCDDPCEELFVGDPAPPPSSSIPPAQDGHHTNPSEDNSVKTRGSKPGRVRGRNAVFVYDLEAGGVPILSFSLSRFTKRGREGGHPVGGSEEAVTALMFNTDTERMEGKEKARMTTTKKKTITLHILGSGGSMLCLDLRVVTSEDDDSRGDDTLTSALGSLVDYSMYERGGGWTITDTHVTDLRRMKKPSSRRQDGDLIYAGMYVLPPHCDSPPHQTSMVLVVAREPGKGLSNYYLYGISKKRAGSGHGVGGNGGSSDHRVGDFVCALEGVRENGGDDEASQPGTRGHISQTNAVSAEGDRHSGGAYSMLHAAAHGLWVLSGMNIITSACRRKGRRNSHHRSSRRRKGGGVEGKSSSSDIDISSNDTSSSYLSEPRFWPSKFIASPPLSPASSSEAQGARGGSMMACLNPYGSFVVMKIVASAPSSSSSSGTSKPVYSLQLLLNSSSRGGEGEKTHDSDNSGGEEEEATRREKKGSSSTNTSSQDGECFVDIAWWNQTSIARVSRSGKLSVRALIDGDGDGNYGSSSTPEKEQEKQGERSGAALALPSSSLILAEDRFESPCKIACCCANNRSGGGGEDETGRRGDERGASKQDRREYFKSKAVESGQQQHRSRGEEEMEATDGATPSSSSSSSSSSSLSPSPTISRVELKRTFSLVSMQEQTPAMFLQGLTESGRFEEALRFARQRRLSVNPIYHSKWLRSKVTLESIDSCLARVEDPWWVLAQIVSRRASSRESAERMLKLGLSVTDYLKEEVEEAVEASDDQLSSVDSALLLVYRWAVAQYLSRLEVYCSVFGDVNEDSFPDFVHLREAPSITAFACDLASGGAGGGGRGQRRRHQPDIVALKKLYKSRLCSRGTRRRNWVKILEHISETTHPGLYEDLLPALDDGDSDNDDNTAAAAANGGGSGGTAETIKTQDVIIFV
eukprot:jgi/Bigna1/78682/fgenesh1_pg.56_\